MRQNIIDSFFEDLSRNIQIPTEVILTGAGAGVLFGHVRMSLDLDFEIRSEIKNESYILQLDEYIKKVSYKTGIEVNYSEDIGHWSMIDLLDYREKAVFYKKFGCLDVKLMAPEYWTIGKISRFLEIDVDDIINVIQKKKIDPDTLIVLWVRALKSSPLSLSKKQFIDHVKVFLKSYGKKAWGKAFESEEYTRKFEKALGF